MKDSQDEKYEAARSILVEAGSLKECEVHGYIFEGGREVEEAYCLGNARFPIGRVFSTRREMTDAIKNAYDDAPADCIGCEQAYAD